MKITCNSCGSKYTIADAKVQGRKVKVRCKSCKEAIVVDGTKAGEQAASPPDAETEKKQTGATAAPAAKSAAKPAAQPAKPKKEVWSVNLSDDDSREMTVAELVAGWKSGLVTTDAYVWKDGMDDWKPVLEVPVLKTKLLAAKPLPKEAGVVSSAGAKPSGGADDLFGSDFSVPPGPGPSAPARESSDQAPKAAGARNESSVLFSLDSMASGGADQGGNQRAADVFGLGSAATPGALTNSPDLLTAPAKDPPPAPAGARSQPIAPAPKKSKVGVMAGLVVALLAAVGAAMMFMGGGGEDPQSDETKEASATAEAEAREGQKKAEEEKKKAEEERKKMEAKLAKAKEEEKKKAEADDEKEDEEEPDEEEKEEEAKKTASASTSSGSSPKPSPKPKPKKKGKFSVSAARSALTRAAANAGSCKKSGGPTGSGKVQVTFATSGRVTSANVVSGPFGGTSVGGCVASVFRRARVPAFSGSPVTVAKSFRIN